ncbi:MAG: 2Fe-2S iron-sulfur cluster-binding protein [Pseudomonadota bacterium]
MAESFRRYRVVRKTKESEVITSFQLVATDGAPLAPGLPGQYLTLSIPGPEGEALRTYSLSCDLGQREHYRLSIKREAAPPDSPDAPDGLGSSYMHDRIEEGDEISALSPRGVFVLDQESSRPVVLLSGGVGLTPMVSMLHSLAGSGRPVWFIHACETGAVHALREEVLGLGRAANVTVHFVYRAPSEADRAQGRFHSEGLVNREILQSLLPLDDYEVYLCGPTPFMRAMYQLLQSLGLKKERIAYEFFGPASSLEAEAPAETPVPVPETTQAPEGSFPITFAKSGVTAYWDGTVTSLLELAEASGLQPEFSCRSGICNSCLSTKVDGEVEYFEEPLDEPEPGEVLLCCSRPKGPVTIDI